MSKASVWRPYNVDFAEEAAEEEVDDTQEIQIEEALKLYQTALKFHSEGPPSFDKTAAAYKALFDSEIFKYAESLSEYQRHEVFGEDLVFDTILEDDYEAGPVQSTGATDSAPNTLQQILHLSYKNHGQFLLEAMQHWISTNGATPQIEAWNNTRGALNYFAEALDKEDTDLDLWLRAASVAAMLGSKRLTRYCLEAVLDGNDEQWEGLLRLPGLEEGFASQQLRELVERLEDNVSLRQAPLSFMKRKKLSETLKKRLNPFSFAPLPSEVALAESLHNIKAAPESVTLTPTKWDWSGIGEVILRQFLAEQQGMKFIVPSGSNIVFSIPPDSETPERIEPDSPTPTAEATQASPEPSPRLQNVDPTITEMEAEAAPEMDGDDTIMEEQTGDAEVKDEEAGPSTLPNIAPAPSRKRSTDSAGLPETAEGGRSRSKRIRGRDTVVETTAGGSAAPETNKLDHQLQPYIYADQCLYEIVKDIYGRLGVESIKEPAELRHLLTALPGASTTDPIDKAACDLFTGLQNRNAKTAQILLSSESFDLLGATRDHGLNAFLGFTKASSGQACNKPMLDNQGLNVFARGVNNDWVSIQDVAFAWMESLCSPGSCPQLDGPTNQSSYLQFRWAEDLKRNVVQVIVHIDEYIYERMLERVDSLNRRMLKAAHQAQSYELSDFDVSQIEIVETLFELHLDIYSLIKHPHSQVDANTQVVQSDRLERWSGMAQEAMQLRSDCQPDQGIDDLALRHIWATVFQMSVNDEVPPEHVLSAMAELKEMFKPLGDRTIQLQNNAVMPELSIAAIDRELVRISMKDFFLKVFDQDEQDPVTVIESLESILEEYGKVSRTPTESADSHKDGRDTSNSPTMTVDAVPAVDVQLESSSPILEMRKFLDSANVNVRLSLWNRLRVAYEMIDYPSKVLSCFLRSIEALVGDFRSSNFQELSPLDRQIKLLTRYRVIDDMVIKILRIIRDDATPFASLPYEHVQSSMSAIAELLHVLSAADMLRDLIRVNHTPIPRIEQHPSQAFINMMTRLDDIHLRLWLLQYHLLKDGLSQNSENFPAPSDDLFEFIRHVHHATGVRGFLHLSNRQFLRLAKDELLRMDTISDGASHATELCQVLHDLYGLKLFTEPLECQNFQTTPDVLDKKTAFSILPFVMSQADKLDLKDLPKTELKGTIEKVHAALGRPKQNEDITFNRKIISTYFKSPVNPVSIFSCLKGVGSLATKHVPPEDAVAASKGWYYMMGNMALSKFRSQKRMTQGPTEDLNYAQAFFVQDLEHSIERWETWYRLAQANDTQLEEAVSWNADKMNSNSAEVVNFQRAAINCYIMAVACAVRDADPTSATQNKIAQMYTEFGNRVYASSRAPFGMEAFQIRESEKRFCNLQTTAGLYREATFVPLQVYTAWKFAGTLFKRAIKGNPKKWWNHFMLGKCGWKMWSFNDDAMRYAMSVGAPMTPQHGPSWESVIEAFISAIEMLPGKKGRSGEPVLEPHYKLVSITHKLFQRRAIDHEKGAEILSHTSFAQIVSGPENSDDWKRYILAVLKSLRAADKSSWHHRIIARSAQIIYDGGKDALAANAAKHELAQTIFTKTMAVQVWKPENERPGRHFVYTTRYTRFFFELLDFTGDKTSFEALAKRVRRKQTDFFEHQKLWHDLCSRYLRLLRRIGNVPEGQEDSAFKSVNHDEFNTLALRLEAWCQNPATQHPVLDVLRDAIELKRMNNGMMKPLLIDDLIGDTYAMLYTLIGPTLSPLPSEQPPQPAQPQPSSFATNATSTGAVPISSLMQVQVDGAADGNNGTPFHMYHPGQLQSQHPPPIPQLPTQPSQPEQPAKSRAKAVGRREIARRAEACCQKAANTATSMPIRSPPPLNAVLPSINAGTASPDKTAQPAPGPSTSTSIDHLQASFDNSGSATAAASPSNDEPTAHSVHDDADDESELSELDEDEVEEIHQEVQQDNLRRSASIAALNKPRFPGLVANRATSVGTKSEPKDEEVKDGDTIHVRVPERDGDRMNVDGEK